MGVHNTPFYETWIYVYPNARIGSVNVVPCIISIVDPPLCYLFLLIKYTKFIIDI